MEKIVSEILTLVDAGHALDAIRVWDGRDHANDWGSPGAYPVATIQDLCDDWNRGRVDDQMDVDDLPDAGDWLAHIDWDEEESDFEAILDAILKKLSEGVRLNDLHIYDGPPSEWFFAGDTILDQEFAMDYIEDESPRLLTKKEVSQLVEKFHRVFPGPACDSYFHGLPAHVKTVTKWLSR